MSALEKELTATNLDHPLEYSIPSTQVPGESYKCELSAFRGNGECDCPDFTIRKRPLLVRRITPEQAVFEEKVKLKAGQRIEDGLRCKHLLEARAQFTDDVIVAIAKADRLHEKNSHHSENPY